MCPAVWCTLHSAHSSTFIFEQRISKSAAYDASTTTIAAYNFLFSFSLSLHLFLIMSIKLCLNWAENPIYYISIVRRSLRAIIVSFNFEFTCEKHIYMPSIDRPVPGLMRSLAQCPKRVNQTSQEKRVGEGATAAGRKKYCSALHTAYTLSCSCARIHRITLHYSMVDVMHRLHRTTSSLYSFFACASLHFVPYSNECAPCVSCIHSYMTLCDVCASSITVTIVIVCVWIAQCIESI